MEPAEHKALQNRLLRKFIERRLYPFSSYYRELFDTHKIRPETIRHVEDLAEIPYTTKQDLMATPADPDRSRRLVLIPSREAISEHWPLGARLPLLLMAMTRGKKHVQEKLRREYYPTFMTFTTGRSANPVPFLYTAHDLDLLRSSGARLSEVCGILDDDKVLNLFPYAPHLAFWQVAMAGFERNIFVLGTGGGKVAGTEGNLRILTSFQPDVIASVPGYLYHVLREACNRGLEIKGTKTVILGADVVPPGMKTKLMELFDQLGSPGVKVIGTYGFTEARMAFGECITEDGSSSGYHLYPDQGIFEIINPLSGEVLPPEADGELVYTPLDGRGTTVLRYRTGDLVEGGLRFGACPHCGRKLPRISSNLKRKTSITNVNLLKVKGTLVNMEEVGMVLANDLAVEEWQVELRKRNDDPLDVDELILYITLKSEQDAEAVESRLRGEVKSRTEISPNEIRMLPLESLLHRVGMEKEMKERRYVDARVKS